MTRTVLNKPATEISQLDYVAPIGAKDKNVYLYDEGGADPVYLGTLRDFYQNWVDFKRDNNFTFTGKTDPSAIEQIKVWYQTYE